MERPVLLPVILSLLVPTCALGEASQTNALAGALPGFDRLDAKIAQLSQPGTTVEKAIELLGQPERYSWENRTLTDSNLPPVYLLDYPRSVSVFVNSGRIIRLQCERPGPGFTWQGRLKLGSTLEEVKQVLGAPSQTVVGQRGFTPGVLYQGFDGNNGYSAYRPAAQQAQFFFQEDKVIAI
jgi:hypothetical protein